MNGRHADRKPTKEEIAYATQLIEQSAVTDNDSTRELQHQGHAIPRADSRWPAGFFESIRIDDPAFVRPDQGGI